MLPGTRAHCNPRSTSRSGADPPSLIMRGTFSGNHLDVRHLVSAGRGCHPPGAREPDLPLRFGAREGHLRHAWDIRMAAAGASSPLRPRPERWKLAQVPSLRNAGTRLRPVKILIVGNGGREHALLWKLRRDAPEAELFITLGNGGTHGLATHLPFKPGEMQALAGWAEKEGVALTVVGPEAPLAEGIVDHFADRGLPAFGPTRAAAEIESSKAFAKALMAKHGIPTAAFRTFDDLAAAEAYVRERGGPLVVKASGLAAGKGAVVCPTTEEALEAVREMLGRGALGEAGREVVVEEFIDRKSVV